MREATDASGLPLADAERVTPFGRWLRSTSLDELPELWNVLRGDMSLVGPRPLLVEYLDRYTSEQMQRHDVRPGLTGLAQISGRNSLSWEEKFAKDIQYVKAVSFLGDLHILLLTVGKVFRREGITAQGVATAPEFLGSPTIAKDCDLTPSQCSRLSSRDALEKWPLFDAEQLAAVEAVLRSGNVNYWTGEECRLFEQEYADFLGVRHTVAVTNGTVALELALSALHIQPGDEVVVPSRTFIATASAVIACGATPVVADIDPVSQTITRKTVEAVLSPKTRAIIAVHLGGWPCEMLELRDLADTRKMYLVEDCAQAHGALYRGCPVGSLGHISAFSFCQDKIISTGGEGGLVATNDPHLWESVWSMKDHGKNRVLACSPGVGGTFRYLHDTFGTNARMTEMQAAIGRIQLRRLNDWVAKRTRNAHFLMASLAGVSGIVFHEPPMQIQHAFYRLYGFLRVECLRQGWSRDRVLQELTARGVPVGCGSSGEIYREKAFKSAGRFIECPIAKRLHETSLAFCVHPTLSSRSLSHIAHSVQAVLAEACVSSDSQLRAA